MTEGATAARPRVQGNQELAQGLMLVRASAMNVARLQLAAHGQDRRRLLESMDELVALDREIGAFVSEISGPDTGLEARQDALKTQRRTLARDKLLLGAGIARRGEQENSGPAIGRGHEAIEEEDAQPDPGLDVEAADLDQDVAEPRRGMLIPALIILLVLALGAAGFLLATSEGQSLLNEAAALLRR